MTRPLLAAFVAAAAGALAGGSLAYAHVPVQTPPNGAWSYLCFEAEGAKAVMEKANRAGAQGWEMVAANTQHGVSTWCFRQPTWARPLVRD